MRLIDRIAFVVTLVLVITMSAAAVTPAAVAKTTTGVVTPAPLSEAVPVVKAPVHYDRSAPLIDLTTANVEQVGQHREIPRRPVPNNRTSGVAAPISPGAPAPATSAPTIGPSFDGIGEGLSTFVVNSAPPDPNGSVGPNHYVETVNSSFAVFTKSGALLYGPVPMNTLWAGFGGGCEIDNDGDPTVIYDPIADRWLISQFAVTTTLYLNCVAVSQTPDPTGAYYRYSYSYTDFPDYPKFGIWPDAYYVSLNLFAGGTTFNGAGACAYDRAKMLSGLPATQLCYQTSTTYGGLLPSTLDGTQLPPAGEPNYFVALDTNSTLVYWKFHPNFTTPASSTFTGPTSLAVAPYTSTCPTQARGECVPQGGTTQKLESLADRLMYRLAYRNFGDHAAMVVNHAVVAGTGSGIRWYELRPSGGALSVFQQGTYAPDANWRWMGSAAMDRSGGIALGYSVSGSAMSPAIHFTGRLATDPAGTMTQGENTIINGTGSQTAGLGRWGDYSSLAVDPVDGCTFWYTGEYLKTNGTFNWSTRVGSFKLPNCGSPDFSLAVTPASNTAVQGASTSYTATVASTGGFSGTVSLSASGLPAGATATFAPATVTTSGTSTLTVATAATTPAGSYPITVTGTSGTLVHSSAVTLVVTAPSTPDFSLSASPASQTVVQGSGTSYTVTIGRVGGFSAGVTLSVSGLPAGAAGTFSPNPASGNSSGFSVTTAGTTPAGSYPLTITGSSGTLSHTTTVTLVVSAAPAGDFTISAAPTSQNVTAGASTSYTITITRTGGFAGLVSFTVSGLGAGATGTFSPDNTGGASTTLTISTTTGAALGTFPLTITGTSGTLTRTTSTTLIVSAGCFGGDGDC